MLTSEQISPAKSYSMFTKSSTGSSSFLAFAAPAMLLAGPTVLSLRTLRLMMSVEEAVRVFHSSNTGPN